MSWFLNFLASTPAPTAAPVPRDQDLCREFLIIILPVLHETVHEMSSSIAQSMQPMNDELRATPSMESYRFECLVSSLNPKERCQEGLELLRQAIVFLTGLCEDLSQNLALSQPDWSERGMGGICAKDLYFGLVLLCNTCTLRHLRGSSILILCGYQATL